MYKCNTDTALLSQILRGNVKKKSEIKSLNSFFSTQGSESVRKFACHSIKDHVVSDDFFVETTKLKVSLNDPPFFMTFSSVKRQAMVAR